MDVAKEGVAVGGHVVPFVSYKKSLTAMTVKKESSRSSSSVHVGFVQLSLKTALPVRM